MTRAYPGPSIAEQFASLEQIQVQTERMLVDLTRLQKAVRTLVQASRVESLALFLAADACLPKTMRAVQEAHLSELDALQALLASFELFERHLTALEAALKRPASAR